ncbi:hypothetical protein JOD67_004121 [Tenggerimyces flavus]|nr:hypothetical protein [Tenggerimyces flavus]
MSPRQTESAVNILRGKWLVLSCGRRNVAGASF